MSEAADITTFVKTLIESKGSNVSMADVIGIVRDLVVFIEKTEADSTGEYKKAAVLEALRVGLDGTDIQGIALDAAPAVIDAVYAMPPEEVVAVLNTAANTAIDAIDSGLDNIGIDDGHRIAAAIDGAGDALDAVGDALDAAQDALDLAESLGLDNEVLDGAGDAIGVAVDIKSRLGGCCSIV